MKTYEECKQHIINNKSLKFVPEEFRTEELCLLAANRKLDTLTSNFISDIAFDLQYVPEQLKTEKICNCFINVCYCGNLQFFPKKLLTKELCVKIIENYSYNYPNILQYIPKHIIDYDLAKISVSKEGLALQFVPDLIKNQELCNIAINSEPIALKWVPEQFMQNDLLEIAIEKNCFVMQLIPEKLHTEKITNLAKKLYPIHIKRLVHIAFILTLIPYNFITQELCNLAVSGNSRNIEHVPENFITIELVELAMKTYPEADKFAPKDSNIYKNYIMQKALK